MESGLNCVQRGESFQTALYFFGVGPCFDGGYGKNIPRRSMRGLVEEGRDAVKLRRGVDMMAFTETFYLSSSTFDEREKPAE